MATRSWRPADSRGGLLLSLPSHPSETTQATSLCEHIEQKCDVRILEVRHRELDQAQVSKMTAKFKVLVASASNRCDEEGVGVLACQLS